MLLVIDIGNTNTVVGVYRDETLLDQLRIESRRNSTTDEYGILLTTLLQQRGLSTDDVADAIIASVVPPLTEVFVAVCKRWLAMDALVVGPGIKTGMPILYDNPREVGADRIVNAIAAYAQCQRACVVVDFGTATTFDVISERGQYLGGIIVPGVNISADALFDRAAKLPRVEIARPPSVVGRTTVHSIQSGLVFGYVAMVEGLVKRVATELGVHPWVVDESPITRQRVAEQ